MSYFAGLFDAEGYITLNRNGAFIVAVEIANENIPNLFKDKFKGNIYTRKRDNRKKTWLWKINSIAEHTLSFIDQISPFSIAKKPQLDLLKIYLSHPRADRREIREDYFHKIKEFKKPSPLILEEISSPSIIQPDETFFQWLAGFIDGDGNIVCNEYIDNRNNLKYFSHQISAFNTFPNVIKFIKMRLDGNVRLRKASLHPIYTWTCKRSIEKFVCESILPHLIIKKKQCELLLEFIKFPRKNYGIGYSNDDKMRMYEIINQIKHLNSL